MRGKGRALVPKLSDFSHHHTPFSVSYNSDELWLFGLNCHLEVISEKGIFREKYAAISDTELEYIFVHITFYWLLYGRLQHLLYDVEQGLENLLGKWNCWSAPLPSSWKLPNFGQVLCISKNKSYQYLQITTLHSYISRRHFFAFNTCQPRAENYFLWNCGFELWNTRSSINIWRL